VCGELCFFFSSKILNICFLASQLLDFVVSSSCGGAVGAVGAVLSAAAGRLGVDGI
jgi:hypothetical protein